MCHVDKVPSERAQKSLVCAERLLQWASHNEESASDFSTTIVSSIRKCIKHTTTVKCHKQRENMWESYFKLCSSELFVTTWTTFLQESIGLNADPVFFQFITLTILENLIKNHFSVTAVNSVTSHLDEQHITSLDYEERNAVRYTAGYAIRSLIKNLKRSANSQKEELIFCLQELISESGKWFMSHYIY